MKRVVLAVEDSNAGVKARLLMFARDVPLWMTEKQLESAKKTLDAALAENEKKRQQKKKMRYSRDRIKSLTLEYRWLRIEVYLRRKAAIAAAP